MINGERRTELFAVGTSHAAAPASLRDALAMNRGRARRFLADLETALPSVDEAAVLSTCTRTEIYLVAPDRGAAERVRDRLARRARGAANGTANGAARVAATEAATGGATAANGDARPERHLYLLEGGEAARHVFRVASGLDSIILGEGQILGQVREARRLAWEEGTSGPVLCQLLDDAVRCGKRIRTETRLARGSVSIASTAARIVEGELGGLERRTVLVLGAGETGTLAARILSKSGVGSLLVVNRTAGAAEQLAAEVDGSAVPMGELEEALVRADAAIFATSAADPLLTRELAERAQAARAGRRLMLVDVANPRDVDPAVGDLDGVTLLDLDDLRLRVEASIARREKDLPRAEAIVDEELARFSAWMDARDVVPLLRALRASFHEIGREVLEAEVRRHGEEYREPLQRTTRRLLNALLHTPTIRLKGLDPSADTDIRKLRFIEDLFELREAESASRPGPPRAE